MSRLPHTKVYALTLSDRLARTLKPYYLSFTIDTSLIIGGHWWGGSRGLEEGLSRDRIRPLDLDRPELSHYAALLAPAMLRIGGTEADRIRYGFRGELPGEAAAERAGGGADSPRGFVLRKKLWKHCCAFAADNGLQLLFTLGAGPESRDENGDWDESDAARLLSYTARKSLPVAAWEFGNEVNAYPFLYGIRRRVSGRRYVREFERFVRLVRRFQPSARTVGPASAIWPLIGEPNALIPALCRSRAAGDLDALSFHYYPEQSSRGKVALRRAKEKTMLNARALDGIGRWIRYLRRAQSGGGGATPRYG